MRKFLLLLAFLPSMVWAGDHDDFGTWLELGAEKSLPYNMELGLEGGLRTRDNSSAMDRWNIGASFGYKPHKYLKLNAGYSLIMDYNTENVGKKWLTPSYWGHRNRFYLDASSGYKFWKWLRVSGRVRYQYTYRPAQDIERYEFVGIDAESGKRIYEEDPDIKHKDFEDRQVLRSRIKFEVDKKHLDWSPFVSVEFHNNLASGQHMHFDKLRTAIGTEYKINKQNSVSLSYVYTLDRLDHPVDKNMHAISAGYSFDF